MLKVIMSNLVETILTTVAMSVQDEKIVRELVEKIPDLDVAKITVRKSDVEKAVAAVLPDIVQSKLIELANSGVIVFNTDNGDESEAEKSDA